MTIYYLDARTARADDVENELIAAFDELQVRIVEAVVGREFADDEAYEVVLGHAELALRRPRAAEQATQIARHGRTVKVKIHLVFGRQMSQLGLDDYGNAVLRNLAAARDAAVTVTDSQGATLSDLLAANR